MEFMYQIKIFNDKLQVPFEKITVKRGIGNFENKNELLKWLEQEYPEYFQSNKVSQRLSKKTDQIVYVIINPLDEYWKHFWTDYIECVVCKKKIPRLEVYNQEVGIHKEFTCSYDCEQNLDKVNEKKNEIYWDERCGYYYIYKITNKGSGKVYVGYTAREPLYRWWEHYRHSDYLLGKAMQVEGIENFTFEVLEKHQKNKKTIDEIRDIETSYIIKYDSINNGYNNVVSSSSESI